MSAETGEQREPIRSISLSDFICINLLRFLNAQYRTILAYIEKEQRASRENITALIKERKKGTISSYLGNLCKAGLVSKETSYYILEEKGKILMKGLEKYEIPHDFIGGLFFKDLKRFFVVNRLYFEQKKVVFVEFFDKYNDFLQANKLKEILKYLLGKNLIEIEKRGKLRFFSLNNQGKNINELFYFLKENLPLKSFSDKLFFHE